ncbi:MAG TPA: TonB-dependent receptor plug domain-containing protein [Sediminibacterium sp.]|nr:TonB-dependent receptor plug domain-containing protein [Sediminibacterium sp.]
MKRVIWIMAVMAASTLQAQENALELDPVTVSASLQSMQASVTGRNIVSIRGNAFEKLPVHSLDELLRYLPGIEVQSRGALGAQSDIVVRGGTFQQVLILLDGVRLNDPNTGHFNSYIPLSPIEIDRIEILKGAASAVFGSDAVGGVIHIITKTFAAKLNQQSRQLKLQTTIGQYDLTGVDAGGVYQKGKTAVSGGLITNDANGQQQRGTWGYVHNYSASVSVSHYLNPNWRLSARTAFDKRDFSAQNFYTGFGSDTAKEKVTGYWNQFSLAYDKNNSRVLLDAGYKKVEDEYRFNPVSGANKNISSLYQVNGRYEQRLTALTSLVGGLQLQDKQIRSNDRGNHQLTNIAGFLVLNQGIGQYITTSAAIRVDHNNNSSTDWSPQINLSYKRKTIQVRASAGKTFRQADFTEQYNNYNKPFVTGGSIGNPDLLAERSFSYEAGVDFFIGQSWKISTGLFRREQEMLIDWVPTAYADMPRKDNLSPLGNYALAKNIGKVNTSGWETDVQFSRSINQQQRVWATVGLVWLDSKISDAAPSFYLSSHAKFLANFNLVYTYNWLGIQLNGLYKTRTAQPGTANFAGVSRDYFVANIKLSASLIKNKAGVFVEADNVFDLQYSDLLGAPMPGKWFKGGIKLDL